jgi:UDP-glucose 4-epimerase
MKILITGGAGFIGSHLAEALICRGDEVYIIDDLSTGTLNNINHLREYRNFHLVIDTILNEGVMNELINKCDQIYHLAAAVGVKLIMNKPVETIETNVKGTEIILALANKFKKKILLASSSEVYGKSLDINGAGETLCETDDRLLGATTKRRWAYACSKTIDEFLALAYYEEKKLPVTIVRFFNTVGPKQTGQYGMVVPNFVQKALVGRPITVYGDGKQTRSFIYVADVVRAIIELMVCPTAVGQIVNLGSDKEISIADLAKKVKEMTHSASEIIYIPYNQVYGPGFEDMQRRTPNIGKLKSLIGFEPKIPLEEMLSSVIEYYQD